MQKVSPRVVTVSAQQKPTPTSDTARHRLTPLQATQLQSTTPAAAAETSHMLPAATPLTPVQPVQASTPTLTRVQDASQHMQPQAGAMLQPLQHGATMQPNAAAQHVQPSLQPPSQISSPSAGFQVMPGMTVVSSNLGFPGTFFCKILLAFSLLCFASQQFVGFDKDCVLYCICKRLVSFRRGDNGVLGWASDATAASGCAAADTAGSCSTAPGQKTFSRTLTHETNLPLHSRISACNR